MKIHKIHIIIICFLLILAYLILGCILPLLHHKHVCYDFKNSFNPENCYSDTECTERVLSIDDNMDALLWRIRVIETAQSEIIFSTFDIEADNSGRDIMSALLHAAERDVHIRILVDGINGMLNLNDDNYFKALISHPNIEVKFYNTINPIKPWEINLRMHDKYLIADDSVYILGGRNTNDLFLGDYISTQNNDRDLLIYETVPKSEHTSLFQLKNYFERIWDMSCNKNMKYTGNSKKVTNAVALLQAHYKELKQSQLEIFKQTDYIGATIATNKVTLLTNPQEPVNKEPELWYMLHQLMINQKNVIIQTPYIVCNNDMYDDLTTLCDSTDRVEILTNAVENGANPWGCTDYLNQKTKILNTGAEVYEFIGEHSSHTKTILIDDRMSIVGSYNLDMRSTYLDTEMMLAVDCEGLNKSLQTYTDMDKAQSNHVYSDGSYEYGEQYQPVEMTFKKKIFYAILRIAIIPFRHLL